MNTEDTPDDLAARIAPCPAVQTDLTLTLSRSSWGETAGLYPSDKNLYDPKKWDPIKECELRRMRAAVHDVAKRNPKVHLGDPNYDVPVEKMLSSYHRIANFPKCDVEITAAVKWFYLSPISDGPAVHPGTTGTKRIKSYGPFHNTGGGDVAVGPVYVHFYQLA